MSAAEQIKAAVAETPAGGGESDSGRTADSGRSQDAASPRPLATNRDLADAWDEGYAAGADLGLSIGERVVGARDDWPPVKENPYRGGSQPLNPGPQDPRVAEIVADGPSYFERLREERRREAKRAAEPDICRCGRKPSDPYGCNHPQRPPWLCRHGLHDWGITTVPIGVRWCERCGQKDPS